MVSSCRKSVFCVSLAISLLSATAAAEAGGFGIREQSTIGVGDAFAGIAAGGDISSMFWNPATLGEVNGLVYETDLTGILPMVNVRLDPSATAFTPGQDQGNIGIGVVVPASYIGYRIDENWIVGLAINSPFGLMTSYGGDSILRQSGVAGTSRVVSIDANPNIAYQISPQLTVAAGLQAQYMELRETAFGLATGTYVGKTNSLGLGFTLGAMFKPQQGTSIGIGYRSGITNTIDGNLTGILPIALDARLKIKTPGTLTIGLSQDITPQWTWKVGAEYTNWSVLDQVPVSGSAAAIIAFKLGSPNIPYNYNDGWFFSTGAEYKYAPDLTLRGGIGYELSPIDNSNRDFRLPDSDRIWLSGGLSYAPAKWYSIDFGYSFLHGFGDTFLASGPGGGPKTNGPFTGSFNANVSIVSLAWKMKL
jgi:long-chain fatty acid transport protein